MGHDALADGVRTYKERSQEWEEHNGKFVLIEGSRVFDFFDTYADAISQGYRAFGLKPFFVKKVERVETVQFITRLIAPSVN